MRSRIRLCAACAALAAVWSAPSYAQQTWREPSPPQANRPTSAGPVRLARAAYEEPLPPAGAAERGQAPPLPLPPPGKTAVPSLGRSAPPSSSRAIATVLGSLGVVLGLFFLVAWLTRRVRPPGSLSLPKEAVDVLGRAPLAGKQQMHLVRVGGKLLLVSVTPTSAETLTEITDRDEVERLSGLCQTNQPGSISATFRQVLAQFEKEPAAGGFVGEATTEPPADSAAPRRRLARSVK